MKKNIRKRFVALLVGFSLSGCFLEQGFDEEKFGEKLKEIGWVVERENQNGGGMNFVIPNVQWDGEVNAHYSEKHSNFVRYSAFKDDESIRIYAKYGYKDEYTPVEKLGGSIKTLDGSFFCDAQLGSKEELEEPCDKENIKRLEDFKKAVDDEMEKQGIDHEDMLKYTKWYVENN